MYSINFGGKKISNKKFIAGMWISCMHNIVNVRKLMINKMYALICIIRVFQETLSINVYVHIAKSS